MDKIAVDFHYNDSVIKDQIHENFEDQLIIESSAFSGTEIITVIISTSAIILDRILNYYIQNRKTLKETTIKIGENGIELSGFNNEEINLMIKNGSLEELKKIALDNNDK